MDLWSLKKSIIALAAALPSALKTIKGCACTSKNSWQAPKPTLAPLNFHPIPPKLSQSLYSQLKLCEWAISITSVLDTPFIQAKVQLGFTDAW